MGKVLLIGRLAARDLRRRPVQAVLVLLAIAAGSTALTLGLALHGVTSGPYQRTRTATKGPDVVAEYAVARRPGAGNPDPRSLPQTRTLIHAPAVTGYSGPYQIAGIMAGAHGITAWTEAQGRDQAPASVDQPDVVEGTWVRPGGVVLERTFAEALGVGVGDRISLAGRSPWPGSPSPPPARRTRTSAPPAATSSSGTGRCGGAPTPA